jgi:hypothetical protein
MAESAQLTVMIPKSHQHQVGPKSRAVPTRTPTLAFKAAFDGGNLQLKL